MDTSELLRLRLHNQRLTNPLRTPEAVVRELVAMQAQEFAMAKWAVALRMRDEVQDPDIARAFDAGRILRTHVMRPTWHFVAPEDIRWLIELTAPRVHAANAYMARKLDITASLVKRSDAIIVRALRDEPFLTRDALQARLAKARIHAAGEKLAYLVMHAELEGLICSGPRVARQFTYALLETRAPAARTLGRDAALTELSRRYLASRGPATARDFSCWSGLTLTQAREGFESLGREAMRETISGHLHLHIAPAPKRTRPLESATFLMPDYDEYGMGYEDRSALFAAAGIRPKHNRMIVVDGRIAGSWRRAQRAGESTETQLSIRLSRAQATALDAAIARFENFARPAPISRSNLGSTWQEQEPRRSRVSATRRPPSKKAWTSSSSSRERSRASPSRRSRSG